MQPIDKNGRLIISREQSARINAHLLAAAIVQCLFFGVALAAHMIGGRLAFIAIVLVAGGIGAASVFVSKLPAVPIHCWLLVAAWGWTVAYFTGIAAAFGFAGLVGWPAALFLVTKFIQYAKLAK